jgi:NodT family efflux transporter outer membrane factor (OMF) lipoprotein
MKKIIKLTALLSPMFLAACAAISPPATQVSDQAASQWYSPLPETAKTDLPHQGSAKELANWWQSLGDPLLVELITSAQAASPSVTAAASRIAQARSAVVTAGAASAPSLNAAASASRGGAQLNIPVATSTQAGLQASWEVDLWGGNRAAKNAALARLEGSQAGWHEARVSVAAEVANTYLNLRTCEQLVSVAKDDVTSRTETSHLTGLLAKAGFAAPADAALARASNAQSQSMLTMQRSQCDMQVKALVALTTLSEPVLRQKIVRVDLENGYTASKSLTNLNNPQSLPAVPSLPAQLLAQRPDVFTAQQEVAAASGDVGSAQAAKYPRLGLNGSLGLATLRSGGISTDGATWSIGPVSVTLPIFDGGQRAAAVDLANANYEAATANYSAKVRAAVREVEEALLSMQSAADRLQDAAIATEGYSAAFVASEARFKSGLGSLSDLEDTRRTALAAKTALLNLERERSAAWVALYRALGGGWSKSANANMAKTM